MKSLLHEPPAERGSGDHQSDAPEQSPPSTRIQSAVHRRTGSRVLDPMEIAPWRDVRESFSGGNQSDGASSPEVPRGSFSPNSSLRARSSGGNLVTESLLNLVVPLGAASSSRPSSNSTHLPKFNPGIGISINSLPDGKMSPSGDSSPRHPDSPTNLFSRLKLFAKTSEGHPPTNKSPQGGRHVQFGDLEFQEGGLGDLAERVQSYSPSSSSSRLHASAIHRSTSYRPHLSKHHPSLSLGGGMAPYASDQGLEDEDASYHPFLAEPDSDHLRGGSVMSLAGGGQISPHVGSSLSMSLNRRSMGPGQVGSTATATHAEGGLQGQTQAALQQLLKEGVGRGKGEDGPRLGRLSLGGALKSTPLTFIHATPEGKGHRRVPSVDGKDDSGHRRVPSVDGKDDSAGRDRSSPSPSSHGGAPSRGVEGSRVSPVGLMLRGHHQLGVLPHRVSPGSSRSSERYSAPGTRFADEDERF